MKNNTKDVEVLEYRDIDDSEKEEEDDDDDEKEKVLRLFGGLPKRRVIHLIKVKVDISDVIAAWLGSDKMQFLTRKSAH